MSDGKSNKGQKKGEEEVDPLAGVKAALAESDALMKELDADIARVLDQDFTEVPDHNSDKRDPLRQTGK